MKSNELENPVLNEQFDQEVENAKETTNLSAPQQQEPQEVDFSQENAELDSMDASLELEDEEELEGEEIAADSTDYTQMSRKQLVETIISLIEERPVQTIRKELEAIKVAFYKARRIEVEAAKRQFIEAGGNAEEFNIEPDSLETELKALFAKYRQLRDEYLAKLEQQKEENYKNRLAIIEELKELVNSNETVNHTFTQFRDLQSRWKESGSIPKNYAKDIWENYHLHVENFYNYVKINNELRDLDLKKNFEAKTALCEEAEELLLDPSVLNAFRRLQKLHEQWREIGPVSTQFKEQLWERFKNSSTLINKRHQDYFESIKDEQKKNLDLKTQLCIKAEELASEAHSSRKDWTKASEELIEVQKVWKSIGFAPKKENTKIYERFRAACDTLFENKRKYYMEVKSEMEVALEAKIALCVAAEALSQSNEWKKSSAELISLQKQWKEIGPVSRKHSDQIWKRFRAACDTFFNRKSEYYAGLDGAYEENLAAKEALCDQIENMEIPTIEEGFATLKALQRRWTEIGFVPMKSKDAIADRYRKAVDKQFAKLRGGDKERKMERYKAHVSSIKDGGDRRVRSEKEKLTNKIRLIEADIALLENNIGFFAHSKNAELMIADVKSKIERGRKDIELLVEKINLLDN